MVVYRSCGLSEDEIWSVIRKFPSCMSFSIEKIRNTMDFLVNEMGWLPADVARVPSVLSYSLEKRIVPSTEEYFMNNFVIEYQEEVPRLLSIFRGEINIVELGFGSEEKTLIILAYLMLVNGSLASLDFYWFSPLSSTIQLGCIQNGLLFTARSLSTSWKPVDHEHKKYSYTVSYLAHSFGFSLESAESISKMTKKVKFESPDKPDAVVRLLTEFRNCSDGVLELLLFELLERRIIPCYNILKSVLVSDVKVVKSLKRSNGIVFLRLPENLSFNLSILREIGVPQSISLICWFRPSLACWNPAKFRQLVNKVIEIGFDPLKSTFAHALVFVCRPNVWERKMVVYRSCGLSEDEIWSVIRKFPSCMSFSIEKIRNTMDFLVNNMGWLPADVARVPSVLSYSLEKRIVPRNPAKFRQLVNKVIEIGFDPLKATFAHALLFVSRPNVWERKMVVYRSCGLSEDEIWSAIRKFPLCMSFSVKKIRNTIDFLVNKMSWLPGDVARVPIVLCYSLEKRIVPRCSVVEVLLLKGLVKGEINLSNVLAITEKCFLDLFVIKYQEEVPQLLSIFRGEINIVDLGFGFQEKSSLSSPT
ncbi:hypothetical protein GH714_035670 [Hevea brasiliensis]|uniref:Uncharacterized protein n=1 Tax=Hevea brasiliensis TaxID=3981 RepID=A0A6A6L7D0_HEVBR|nr:hypothetical protein GH714_035670 [Hevea brasiliensis]